MVPEPPRICAAVAATTGALALAAVPSPAARRAPAAAATAAQIEIFWRKKFQKFGNWVGMYCFLYKNLVTSNLVAETNLCRTTFGT